jgi:hypothetical protein
LQGASAIDQVLKQFPVKTFVVWEPVLVQDWAPPGAAAAGRIASGAATQYWDRGLALSTALKPLLADPSIPITGNERLARGRVVWDLALVYPAGAKWGARPLFAGGPVVRIQEQLAVALRK